MIKNERQYRITRAQANRFAEELHKFENEDVIPENVHPILVTAWGDALRSQLTDLEDDLKEYDDLKAGNFNFDQLNSVAHLPELLIKARIARGLGQRELAELLGLKEQQIQRYEATEYASASLNRIKEVVAALGVQVDDSVLSTSVRVSLQSLFDKVSTTGLPGEFIRKRLIPLRYSSSQGDSDGLDGDMSFQSVAESIARVFQCTAYQLVHEEELDLEPAMGGVRFKMPANANPERVNAYTVYAHYLSMLASQACSDYPIRPIPIDPTELRERVVSNFGSLSLGNIVNQIWDLGMPVLPLDDPGIFHGACFRRMVET